MSDEQRIRELLKGSAPPAALAARERTAAAARAAVPRPVRDSRRFNPAWAVAAIAAVIALTGFSLTPQGRAVAEDIAELVGIGDPATVDHGALEGPIEPTTNETVIGAGETPDGVPFEIVAYEGRISEDKKGPPFAGTCISLDWPELADPRGGERCIDGPQRDPLPVPGATDPEGSLGPGAALEISGLTGPEVDRVDVVYTNRLGDRVNAPVTIAKLDGRLAKQAGTTQEAGFFVAFLPDEDVGQGGFFADVMTTVELVAYGASSEVMERLDYGRILKRHRSMQAEHEEFERQLDARVERAREHALLSEQDCPAIARALREAGRAPDSIRFAGSRCPTIDQMRNDLEHNPDLKSIVDVPGQ